MPQLYERFTYNEKDCTPQQVKFIKQRIIELEQKLMPLKDEIMNYPQGRLHFTNGGTFYVSNFPDELARSIRAAVS